MGCINCNESMNFFCLVLVGLNCGLDMVVNGIEILYGFDEELLQFRLLTIISGRHTREP